MGYSYTFKGKFTLDRPLAENHRAYLRQFNETRRVRRSPDALAAMPDPAREAVGLPPGEDGGYFTGGTGSYGQDRDASIIDYNRPPSGQPSLWCSWTPTTDGTALQWDGAEKFGGFQAWLSYLIEHFLTPWGYVLNGSVRWRGEDPADAGILTVTNNSIAAVEAISTFDQDEYRRLNVFVCSRAPDETQVAKLREALDAINIRLWYEEQDRPRRAAVDADEDEDDFGHTEDAEYPDAILLCYSHHATQGESFLHNEITRILAVVEASPRYIHTINVQLEPCEKPAQVLAVKEPWQHIELFEPGGFAALETSLRYVAYVVGEQYKQEDDARRKRRTPSRWGKALTELARWLTLSRKR